VRRTTISHEFVEFVPSDLEDGVLYVSVPYATAVHLCPCGCGIKVVTPISPPEWQLRWDGDTVSLHPSIGNWQFPCRSHYWIRRNRVEWAPAWTDQQIVEARRRDARELEEYFAGRRGGADAVTSQSAPGRRVARPGLLHRFFDRIRGRSS